MRYPAADREPIVDHIHGQAVPDPYRWLEDVNDPRTTAWSAAQDEFFAAAQATWPRRAAFQARLTELHAVGSVGAPRWRGDRAFVLRRTAEQDHAVFYTLDPDGIARALVDPMAIDPSGLTTLDFAVPSPDGSLVAYGLSHGGTEVGAIRVLEVASGSLIDGPIDRVRHSSIAWLPDNDGFYYVRQLPDGSVEGDDAAMHRRIHLHQIGTDPDGDAVTFGEGFPRATYFDVDLSLDGRWLTVSVNRGTDPRNDLWLADRHGGGEFVPVQVDVDAHAYLSVGRDGIAYIYTNRDAPRWRLCVADPAELVAGAGYDRWRTLIHADDAAVLESFAMLDDPAPRILAQWARHAVGELTVHDKDSGTLLDRITLPGTGTVTDLVERRDGGHEAWIGYTDYLTPERILRYDGVSGLVDVWDEPDEQVTPRIPINHQVVTYRSYDGTDIHMSLVTPDGQTGPVPTILYGYGGFNITIPPSYDPWIIAWTEAGGAFAHANLRGGGEEGENWHRAGMREAKQNVFDDFHAASDWLVDNAITSRDRLGIFGGSNGGLLVGAALTQQPTKYAAAVCSAPLLDMLRYELFALGALWTGEYGSVADLAEFGWLHAYSPYHHISPEVAYPATLFTVFEGDTRVDPLHARKMCAALQAVGATDRPVLIRREVGVGHAGRSVSRVVDLATDRIAFFAAMLGLTTD